MKTFIKIATFLPSLLLFIKLYSQQTIKEQVSLQAPGGNVLSGEIEYPGGVGKFPAAILVWGNGPHTRDQEISKSPTFKQIANYLCSKGMAVLRMDKRGFGKSSGKFTSEGNYTTQDLADDIQLAYNFLNRHPKVDTSRVGLIGHSEGALIAAMIAAREPGIDWLIVYGVPAVRGDSILMEQKTRNRMQLGMRKTVSDSVGKAWEKYLQYIESGRVDDSAYYAIGREFLIAHGLDKNDKRITNEFIDQLLSDVKSDWFRWYLKTDPSEFFSKIKIPLLAVFGSEDFQASVEQNLIPLNNALSTAGNKDYRIVVLPDEDHFFLRYQDQRLKKHQPGAMNVSGRLLELISGWLKSQRVI